MHVVVNATTRFGFHRDEFLYFSMGTHLRLWRMDFPPGIAIAANVVRATFGDSLTAIRMVPTLAGTALLVMAVLIARELGGGRAAQAITALLVLVCPLFLRTTLLFQPVVLDQLAWTVALYALLRLCRDDAPRWWVLVGVSLGFGLLVKFSVLLFGFALFVALLVSPQRAALRTRWPWVAAALAFAIGSPSIAGQFALHFPVVGQMGQLRTDQLEHVTYFSFVSGQLEWGVAAWLGLVALIALVVSRRFGQFRLVGYSCLCVELLLMTLRGKSYYIGPIFPTLIAAGAVMLETGADGVSPRPAWLRVGTPILAAALLALVLPVALPVLSPERTAAYIGAMHLDFTRRNNQGGLERLPQDYSDMLGWEEQVQEMSRAFQALTPEQQRMAVIGAANYGRAGALDFYGPRYGLPPVISSAGSFWFFGPGDKPGEVALIIENTDEHLKQLWDEVRPVGHIHNDWAVGEERDVNIYLCLRPKQSLQRMWPSLAD